MKRVSIRSFSGPCFPVFSPNTGKYGPEKTPYLDTLGTMSQQFTATRDRSIAKNYLRLTYNKNYSFPKIRELKTFS